jgi:hypothetical protein
VDDDRKGLVGAAEPFDINFDVFKSVGTMYPIFEMFRTKIKV